MIPFTRKVFLALHILPLLISCKSDLPEIPPNIVWITSEDNSVHYMKMYEPDGAPTPNIKKLAEEGLIYRNAFSNAPVCSVARSTIISGCYAPRIGAQYHRKMEPVPMPRDLHMFPAYLRQAGYYTTNNDKEDYNLIKGENVWDESSRKAHWKNRREGQPFFHVFNIATTHESRLHFSREEMSEYSPKTGIDTSLIFPVHPHSQLFAYTNAYYRDKIMKMDLQVGDVVKELEDAGLMETTFIFYFGDHGGVLPGSKGYLYETGLHVPMVVYIPEKYKYLSDGARGTEITGFVDFMDLAPTVLNLAGVDIPAEMDGKPFLGKDINSAEMDGYDETLGYADRFDEKYDMVRSLRKGKYKYIRSFQPFNFDGLQNNYRYIQLAYQEWRELYHEGALNALQSRFFETRPPEMLFDLDNDPDETVNLVGNPNHLEALRDMRDLLNRKLVEMPDLSFFPEHVFLKEGASDPVAFGQENSDRIARYLEIANLQLENFAAVKVKLLHALSSNDPWERYWGLISCSTLGDKQDGVVFSDASLISEAQKIVTVDPELLNRVRASEFLAITGIENPVPTMTRCLYASKDATEALLILNSIVLMQDGKYQYKFYIDPARLTAPVSGNAEVQRRIKYLVGDI